jgi:hypothetical protein
MNDGSNFHLHGFTSPLWDYILHTADDGSYSDGLKSQKSK